MVDVQVTSSISVLKVVTGTHGCWFSMAKTDLLATQVLVTCSSYMEKIVSAPNGISVMYDQRPILENTMFGAVFDKTMVAPCWRRQW